MIKRELVKILAIAGIGLMLGIILACANYDLASCILFMPVYLVGMFYAGSLLLHMLGSVIKEYFQLQILSFFLKPLFGTIVSALLLATGLFCIFTFGWIIGIGKCVYAIVLAAEADHDLANC